MTEAATPELPPLVLKVLRAEGAEAQCTCFVCHLPGERRPPVEYTVLVRAPHGTLWLGLHEQCRQRTAQAFPPGMPDEIAACLPPRITRLEDEARQVLLKIGCECTHYAELLQCRVRLERIRYGGGAVFKPPHTEALLLEVLGLITHEETIARPTITPLGSAAVDFMRRFGERPTEWPGLYDVVDE